MKEILIVCGSLRKNSSTHAVIDEITGLDIPGISFQVYEGIGSLPHFDDSKEPYPAVEDWRDRLRKADGVLICTPEYAFGIPGSLKNALDWTVGSGELVGKPLALVTAATGGDKAHAALLQVFTALSAGVTPETSLLISFIRSKMNAQGKVSDETVLRDIRRVVMALKRQVDLAAAGEL